MQSDYFPTLIICLQHYKKKNLSAVGGQRLADLTVETLKRIRNENSFGAFYDSILEGKKSLPDVGEPILKRKRQLPERYDFGKAPAEHLHTPCDHYRKNYFEAIDLLISHIEYRFQQPSFQIFQRLESLLVDCSSKEIQDQEIEYIGSIYDEVDIHSLSAQLQLFRIMMKDQKLTCFDEIHSAVKNLSIHERLAIYNVIKIVNLLHVNPCSSASGERTFSTARRIKTWLRARMSQERFNSVSILNTHKNRTDSIDLIAIANSFVCNDNRLRVYGRFTENDLK